MISLRDVVTGFGNRDPLAEVWRRDLRGGGSSAEITGTLPLSFSGRGKPLTDYLISGNAVQDGTPSSQAPVDAVGCGVRTGNLWDEDYTGISGNLKYVPLFVGEGTFTLSTDTPDYLGNAPLFLLSGNVTSGASTPTNGVYNGVSRTTNSSNGYITIAFRRQSEPTNPITHKTMLNLGSTALPYEPYGYKLPPTVNGTEYPIYLGQVETTKRIKKLVLTGEESNWSTYARADSSTVPYLPIPNFKGAPTTNAAADIVCTHYATRSQVDIQNLTSRIGIAGRTSVGIIIADDSIPSLEGFKSYLAAQYSAGTPVTVWYVLEEPETGIVNEPLMKIGDYADTISFAQAGVTIPTASGANVLDMTSTVKPSEVYIKGKGIKPTGYGQLVDKNGVRILDKNDVRILVHGQ